MPYNLKKIFQAAFKSVNPNINVTPGYPVYDTMIKTNSKAFDLISSLLNTLEENVDYSAFFGSDGTLVSNEKFAILKDNLFLGDGLATRGRVSLIFEFPELQDEIIVNPGLTVARDEYQFRVPEGTYQLPVYAIYNKKVQYVLTAVSVTLGDDVPILSPGGWIVSTGSLPSGALRVFSDSNSSRGIGNAGSLTVDNVRTLMSNKALDTPNAIINAINSATDTAGVIPDRISACDYSDEEYLSGVVPFQDEDEDVKQFRFGGYTDIRGHAGVEVKEFYFESGELYGDGLYRFYFTAPVYAVTACNSWVTGSLETSLPFTFNYVDNYIICKESRIRVSVITTSNIFWSFLQSTILTLKSSPGTIKLLPYFPIRIYVDTDCVDPDYATSVNDLNAALSSFFSDGGTVNISFSDLRKAILEATGITVIKFKYYLPDAAPGATPIDFNGGNLSGLLIVYGPENLTVNINLTDKNTILVGGYPGVFSIT